MRIIPILFVSLACTFVLNVQAQVQAENTHTHLASKAAKKAKKPSSAHSGKKVASQHRHIVRVAYEPPSMGKLSGLQNARDNLNLKSSVALVVDQDTHEVLFSKNDSVVLPIASITKLMTAVVTTEANLPMNDVITLTNEDITHASSSRLRAGTSMTRQELLHLALMSSENRAAYALGRSYPGGVEEFVRLMNTKAQELGMTITHYVEPTGLSSDNRSTAQDLAKLVAYASHNSTISEFSTSHGYQLAVGKRMMQYVNTDRLTSNPNWDIDVQKTGFINAAGHCLVMQTKIAGRKLVMVLLDSVGKYSRIGDAERVRAWVESLPANAPHT